MRIPFAVSFAAAAFFPQSPLRFHALFMVPIQGASMLADVATNAFPNAHVARWEHPPLAGHTG